MRSGRCPKCQSLEVARRGGGWQMMTTGEWEYTVYLCLDCGFEERYVNKPREGFEEGVFEMVNPSPDGGPYR